jgi:hypothetical protein
LTGNDFAGDHFQYLPLPELFQRSQSPLAALLYI